MITIPYAAKASRSSSTLYSPRSGTEEGDDPWQLGLSELAATNAPVEDEPVQPVLGMNQNDIRTAQIFIFSPASTLPQNISPLPTFLPSPTSYLPTPTSPLLPTYPLLPTTYQPLPPHSIARALSSKDVERERVWSGLEVGTSLELGAAGARPTQDPCKHFSYSQSSFFFKV